MSIPTIKYYCTQWYSKLKVFILFYVCTCIGIFQPQSKEKSKEKQNSKQLQQPDSQKGTDIGGPSMGSAVVLLLMMLLVLFAVHCTWVTSNAYSSPSVVLSTNNYDG